MRELEFKPEFAIGDTVTYKPYDEAFQAEVVSYRYLGARTHHDELDYILRITHRAGDILANGQDMVQSSCRSIYESAFYSRAYTIRWS